MPASETSKSVIVGIATQGYHSSHTSYTQATSFHQLLLTEWSGTPTVSFDEMDDEMDGAISPTAVPVRLGVSTPVRAAGRLRSDTIIRLLRANGFAAPTTTTNSPVSGAHTHVLIPATNDSGFPWSSFLVHMGLDSTIKRVIRDVRLAGTTLSGERNAVARFASNGIGGHEQVAVGSGGGAESITDDDSPVLRTVEGSFSIGDTSVMTNITPIATTLNGAHTTGSTVITVVSTTNFPSSGTIRILAEGANTEETIAYTGKTATTFTGLTPTNPTSAHSSGAGVQTSIALPNTATVISVVSTTGFASSGSIRIESEGGNTAETITYSSKTATTFAGVNPTYSHGAGANVYQTANVLTGTARNFSVDITNEFTSGDDNFIIGNHEFDWQTWLSMIVMGQVDTVFSKTMWEKIFYGGDSAAGSDYSFTPLTGSLDVTVKSATMITGTTPYSMRIEIPHLSIMQPDDIRASGRSELRMVLPFRAYVASSDPLVRITFVNNKTSYA